MKVLVLNSGSSSLKYQLFDMGTLSVLASGLVEKIGEPAGHIWHRKRNDFGGFDQIEQSEPVPDHRSALRRVVSAITESGVMETSNDLFGLGHRVVHGGEAFRKPTLIDAGVVESIRMLCPLAPLHNPANLTGIELALEIYPDVPQVAVFDSAFHQTMPPYAFHYALPRDFYSSHHVRRYGFHGTSHQYVAKQAALHFGRPPESLNLISLHLGNGASATAVQAGKSIDTSMGLTPLEGLVMGTRCGDLDPAIHFYLRRVAGLSDEELESIFNQRSGLKGLCGANDMREVIRFAEAGNADAELAITMYCYRIRKYIGAYFAVLGRVDALLFTGGVGENSPWIRKRSCAGLTNLGIVVDDLHNQAPIRNRGEIQSADATVKVLVLPTNEELEIARQTVGCIQGSKQGTSSSSAYE